MSTYDLGEDSRYTSIARGIDGLGLISYQTSINRDLKVAYCDDPACSSATITNLDSFGDVGMNTSIAIGTDGLGIISYVDNNSPPDSDNELKVAHCINVMCTNSSSTSAIITVLDTGTNLSILHRL